MQKSDNAKGIIKRFKKSVLLFIPKPKRVEAYFLLCKNSNWEIPNANPPIIAKRKTFSCSPQKMYIDGTSDECKYCSMK